MNIAVGFACLVAMAITAGVTVLPEQQLAVDEQLDGYDDDLLERKGPGGCGTRMFCGIAGGRCQPKDDECDGELRTNKFYCKGGKKCGCCIPRGPPGCVFGFNAYEDGAVIEDVCMVLQCVKGDWKYLGKVRPDCGNCTLWGDPHIFTFEPHNLDGTGPIPSDLYQTPAGHDYEYAISQHGKSYDSLFGVYANFTECWGGAYTCVSRVHYAEPGIEVELILPEKEREFDETHQPQQSACIGALPLEPLCATKILVNDKERVIADGGSVTSLSGTDGTVLIFKDGKCTSAFCQIYVVGSKGITVSLLVEPKLDEYGDSEAPELYQLNVYPTPSLRHQLYGLCDTFTGTPTIDTAYYTPRNGTDITDFDNLDEFVESWNTEV